VKVLDFGVAKLADNEAGATLTQTGMIFGTPKYMSPEQAEGKPIDYRADIYAIGVVLYELIVGRPPFLAETPVGLLLKHIQEIPPPFKRIRPDLDVAPELERIVMKTLEKSPDLRYTMVADLRAELEACLRSMTTGMYVVPSRRPTEPVRPAGQVPTEVVPGQSGSPDLSGPKPPQAVPSGMNFSIPSSTPRFSEPPPPSAAPTAPGVLTSPSGPGTGLNIHHAPTEAGFGSGVTPTGITNPIEAPGPGIDTLGGLRQDASGPLRAPGAGPSKGLIAGIAGAVVVALVAVYVVRGRGSEAVSVVSEPIKEATDPGPKPAEKPPEPAVAAPEVKVQEPDRPKDKPADKHPGKGGRPGVITAPPKGNERSATRVYFSFESSPSGAVVYLDGKELGRTPFKRDFVQEPNVLSFDFRLGGYEDHHEAVTPAVDRTIRATMKAVEAAARPKEPAKETPKPKKADKPDDFEKVDDIKDM
jgi:hypothetical protein